MADHVPALASAFLCPSAAATENAPPATNPPVAVWMSKTAEVALACT